jgi:dihydroxyacetone kinase-like predicted kinase
MALDTKTITDKAKKFQVNDSMALAASSIDQDASEDEVREAVAEIVAAMLEERSAIIRWLIGETWAAKLVARVVDALGKTLLEWLR